VVLPLLLGENVAVEVTEVYRDEYRRKVERGIAGVSGEKIRLMWLQNRIQFSNPIEEILEREHRAAVVADELNDVTWQPVDPSDPYDDLAARMMSIPLVGSVDRRIRHLERMAGDYRVDGVLNPCHWGCRQGSGARGLITEGLKRKGLPVLNLEVDCVDPRNFAEGQLRTRIEAFMEMLDAERTSGRACVAGGRIT
jgi:benzoyl-CoA reductase/2-hydroxyglutaryl-CoA dehydratase subunit BcrC/BadD/HgdB